jgi:hypothetical protein
MASNEDQEQLAERISVVLEAKTPEAFDSMAKEVGDLGYPVTAAGSFFDVGSIAQYLGLSGSTYANGYKDLRYYKILFEVSVRAGIPEGAVIGVFSELNPGSIRISTPDIALGVDFGFGLVTNHSGDDIGLIGFAGGGAMVAMFLSAGWGTVHIA